MSTLAEKPVLVIHRALFAGDELRQGDTVKGEKLRIKAFIDAEIKKWTRYQKGQYFVLTIVVRKHNRWP